MITIIAAVARNRAIGNKNKLIYWLPNDLKRFKQLTTGHTIIMGRNTFESLPKGALPNRRNIVLSRTFFSSPKFFVSEASLWAERGEARRGLNDLFPWLRRLPLPRRGPRPLLCRRGYIYNRWGLGLPPGTPPGRPPLPDGGCRHAPGGRHLLPALRRLARRKP